MEGLTNLRSSRIPFLISDVNLKRFFSIFVVTLRHLRPEEHDRVQNFILHHCAGYSSRIVSRSCTLKRKIPVILQAKYVSEE